MAHLKHSFMLLETLIYLIADVTHMPKSNIASLASLLICLLKLWEEAYYCVILLCVYVYI